MSDRGSVPGGVQPGGEQAGGGRAGSTAGLVWFLHTDKTKSNLQLNGTKNHKSNKLQINTTSYVLVARFYETKHSLKFRYGTKRSVSVLLRLPAMS